MSYFCTKFDEIWLVISRELKGCPIQTVRVLSHLLPVSHRNFESAFKRVPYDSRIAEGAETGRQPEQRNGSHQQNDVDTAKLRPHSGNVFGLH